MEKETKTVYVVTMAIYNENDEYLHVESLGVFTSKEDAEHKLEREMQNHIETVCDLYEIKEKDIPAGNANGMTIVDIMDTYGEKTAFRIDECPILERNRSFL